jgi:signal transduction histidine kinase
VLILLPVLAALQYRWLGQVSEHERERLRRAVTNATRGIARDLDTELTRAMNRLDLKRLAAGESPAPVRGAPGDAAIPDSSSLIREVMYVERRDPGEQLAITRCDLVSGVCGPSEWPPALHSLNRDLARLFRRGSRRDAEDLSRIVPGPTGRQPVIVAPVAAPRRAEPDRPDRDDRDSDEDDDRRGGVALLLLNTEMLRGVLIPALVERHFGPAGESDFRVAVVDRELPLDVVYAAGGGSVDDLLTAPEAWQELFTLRIDEFTASGSRDEGGLASASGVRVFGRDDDDDDDEEWMLVARHREGSLQAAVENLRRRNLLLSSGILALMGVAVGLIALTSRRAQRLAHQQVEFVAGVSHELRTPVAAIHLAAQNLADGMVADPSRVRRYGATIQLETQRLRETVERVLQFASLSARRASAPTTAVYVDTLIDEAVASARRDYKDVELVTEVPPGLPPVEGDPAELGACLQNLLANAIKYGGPSPHIRIAATIRQGRRGSELQIAVQDDGPGIDPRDLAHVFEPFYRGRNALERRIQGNGLGLHIVRRIAEAHGGRVTVRSSGGEGATFVLHLPMRAAQVARGVVADQTEGAAAAGREASRLT